MLSALLSSAGAAAQTPTGVRREPPLPQWFKGFGGTSLDGDAIEFAGTRGLWYRFDEREIRADSVVIRMDRDEYMRWFTAQEKGLPHRGMTLPDPRRTLTGAEMARRLLSFMESLGSPRPGTASDRELTRLFRSIYLEGHIVIVDHGVEVLTADSLMFSVPDNRVVLQNAELRLVSRSKGHPDRTLVLRAPRLVKQGSRITGRDVSLTTCSAGEPHFEVLSRQIELVERGGEFEVFSRGNNLAFSGRRTVPLPDAHFFTSEQSDIPLRGVRARYSSSEGVELGVDLGGSMNQLGGALHELVTGLPASDFRGEWRLGLGYIEERGNPFDGELTYRGGDVYEGRTKGFYMGDDRGPNRQFITSDIAGTPITESERTMLLSENRIHLAENWTFDITAFSASDPAVYPEFYRGDFQHHELPESSLHLRHAAENRLLTVTGRANLATFSYGDDRALAPSFVEEEPLATYDVFSEPLFSVGDADVLLTSATSAGWLKRDFDPKFPTPIPASGTNRTRRLDQELELAAPFHLGPFAVRPHASARFTHYDNSVSGLEQERWAFDAGISVTTRLARTFGFGSGGRDRVLHTIYPSVSLGHLYKVDVDAAELYQFDETDSLNEHGVIRVGMLNLFHSLSGPEPATRNPFVDPDDKDPWKQSTRQRGQPREFLYLDLAQNFIPINDRDNNGEVLGLGEYELIWRPYKAWIPVDNLGLLVEGEHDWDTGRARTFNSLVRFGPVLGLNWQAGYRTDFLVDGAVLYGVNTELFGRWTLSATGSFDLQTDEQLAYSAMLVRRDHDWLISLALTYDTFTDDTSFRIDFEPLFGGLGRRRAQDFAGMSGTGADAMLNR